MKKLSYLFAVAASAACLCACTDVTDVLPAEQIPADARSTLGGRRSSSVEQRRTNHRWFWCGAGRLVRLSLCPPQASGDYGCDVRTGRASPQYPQGRGIPHYDETTFNMDEDINLSLDDPFSILISTVMRIVLPKASHSATDSCGS